MDEVTVRFARHPDDLDFDPLVHVHVGALDGNSGWLAFTACARPFVVDAKDMTAIGPPDREVPTDLGREVDGPATCIECLGARPWTT